MLRSSGVRSLPSSISLMNESDDPSPSRCFVSLLDGVFLSGPFFCRLSSLLLGIRSHADSLSILTMIERQRCDIAVATSMMSKNGIDEVVRENLRSMSERVLGESPLSFENAASEDNVESVMEYAQRLSSAACNADVQSFFPLSLFPWL